jgi:hypothetical protein
MFDVPVWTAFGNHDMLTAKGAHQRGPFYFAFDTQGTGRGGGVPSHSASYYRYRRGEETETDVGEDCR